jgi:hypothetical protein
MLRTPRVASAAGRLRPNAVLGQVARRDPILSRTLWFGAMRTICADAGGLGQRGVACAGTEAERGEFCESSAVGQLRVRQRLAEPYLRLLKPRNVSTLSDHGQKRFLHVPSGQSGWRHYSIFHVEG